LEYQNPWLFEGKPFTSDMIGNYYGFVYCITNLKTGKRYIGRKYFYKTVKKGKRRIKVESDWKDYWSSSELVKKDVDLLGKDSFKREIISLHVTKGDTNYFENYMLFKMGVLEEPEDNRTFYNDNIMNRYYYKSMKNVGKKRKISSTFC